MKKVLQQLIEKIDVLIERNTNIYAKAALKDIKFEIEHLLEEIPELIKSDKADLPTKEEIERNATIYAEEQNSCYSNDYYGFINGAKYILSLIQKHKQ